MLAIRKTAPRPGLEVARVQEPDSPGHGEVILEVAAAGICGSDVHVYEWTRGYEWMQQRLPVTLGHEFAGRIVAVGSAVEGLRCGDQVTVWPTVACMRCPQCLRGQPQFCSAKVTLGLDRDGAFAKYVRVPAVSCFALPSGLDPAIAALTEPLCVGENAVRVAGVELGDTVLVLGPGTIGQACAFMARRRGAARVIVVGKNDAPRLGVADRVGATDVLDLAQGLLQPLLSATLGIDEVDVVVEATGAAESVSDGLRVLRRGGVLASAGIHARPVEVDMTALVRKKQQIRGAHGSTRRSWESVVALLAESTGQLRPMITHRIGLDDAIEGFELSRKREASKVVLCP
jgi:2-desacetyl-2-hydroxyethyl bacteriochlorophyllide A dehydrogenase